MNNLTAARDAVGSEEPIATGGWSFLNQEFNEMNEVEIGEINELTKARLWELIKEIDKINELNKARLRQLVDALFSRWCV
jgi:hypothetical protein